MADAGSAASRAASAVAVNTLFAFIPSPQPRVVHLLDRLVPGRVSTLPRRRLTIQPGACLLNMLYPISRHVAWRERGVGYGPDYRAWGAHAKKRAARGD